ncbi:hypothetical protein QQF64_006316 [Cirrhinus molitorella]|uniref:Reverse transcriptase Ty1/copia-type domain-containing protein n=1 Tax=Cirrhinus molitorella TaxID=172907 RepID=A0ABR3MI14_9TELE
MQTSKTNTEYEDINPKITNSEENVGENVKDAASQGIPSEVSETLPEQTGSVQPGTAAETIIRKNPPRARRMPAHLQDFETENMTDKLQTCIDFCYKAVCDIPQTYQEAISSTKSKQWKNAMDKEMQSLEENKTFTLTKLPQEKQPVGGRWVYTLKRDIDGSEKYKARFVAKGYSQRLGTDYDETFSPTADLTSVRVVMQKAVQENLILQQMDVETAYLHAPIDHEVYVEQPEGYEQKSETGEMLYAS